MLQKWREKPDGSAIINPEQVFGLLIGSFVVKFEVGSVIR